ncbi:MAG: hypothetical protein R3F65_00170 [bacterium]|nr:hypothetical protein [Myxococcales bacterium]
MFFGESEKKSYHCHKCGHEIDVDGLQRRDECRACGADLHVCKNCQFWDPSYQNECRENTSHYIRDREKANFCMSFTFKPSDKRDAEEANDARAKLEALFKKLK